MNEITTTPVQAQVYENTPNNFINTALANNAPIETIEKLMQLHERWQANQARDAFVRSMASFQGECPTIEKTKDVMNNGRLMYKYAPLDAIVSKVRPILAKHNLAYTVTVEQTPEAITVTCKITHAMGHSETSSFSVPIVGTNMMSAPQKVASALTYAKRYAFCNALGILTGDEDTDATDVREEKKPLEIKSQILFLLKSLKKAGTTDEIKANVIALTGIELEEKNYEEIRNRLEMLVLERNADTTKEL